MKITALGVKGGLGSGRGTSAVMVNGDTLIDVGSGIEGLSLGEAQKIRRVFLTHAHMDHINGLPLLVEAVFDQPLPSTIQVHALPGVLKVLRDHVFNGEIWPDFEKISHRGVPSLDLRPFETGKARDFSDYSVIAFPTHHDVRSSGFCLKAPSGNTLVITGDTGYSDQLVTDLNALGRIKILLIECSLPNRLSSQADQFFHLTPSMIERLVSELTHPPEEIWLSHLKPSVKEEIPAETLGTPLGIVHPGQTWKL